MSYYVDALADSGSKIGCSVRDAATGQPLDFSTSPPTFVSPVTASAPGVTPVVTAVPVTPTTSMTELAGIYIGTFFLWIDPSNWTDGYYVIYIHDLTRLALGQVNVIRSFGVQCKGGVIDAPQQLVKVTTIVIAGTSFDVYGLPTPLATS